MTSFARKADIFRRLGTRKDMEKQLAFDPAGKEVRLPQYGTLAGYAANIEWNIHRWCGYWGRGI